MGSFFTQSGNLPPNANRLDHELVIVDGDGTYYYDSTRDKWLSTTIYSYSAGAGGAASNVYLLFTIGGRMSSTWGYYHAHDLTLVGLEYVTEGASADASYAVEVREDGSAVHTETVGTAVSHQADDLDVDIGADNCISYYMSGTGADNVHVRCHFRRVRTAVP